MSERPERERGPSVLTRVSSVLAINRPTAEFVGGTLYTLGLAGLNGLAGLLPVLDLSVEMSILLTVDFLVLIIGGGIAFAVALRKDDHSWPATLGIILVIAAIVAAVVYVPLWFITSDLAF